MTWNDNLEGNALEIARSNDSLIRVMAGPGTGKSFALQRRVQRLIEEENINPNRIMAVTFTRNAAKNLIDELRSLNISGCENIKASTLHAYAFKILKRDAVFEYLNRNPRPLVGFSLSGVMQFEYAPMTVSYTHLRAHET